MAHPLDNPIWNSLSTDHADRALATSRALRYPPEVAPFMAVESASSEAESDLCQMVNPGEQTCILSVFPRFSSGWQLVKQIGIVQMIWESQAATEVSDLEIVLLGEMHLPAMLELTALVYPAYFRAETAKLGAYFGILDQGRLIAMAGIRMSMPGFQEISGVCTHPNYRSRGYARRLMLHLVSRISEAGNTPFLHTEEENHGARAVYDHMGFTLRRTLPFQVVDRVQNNF